MFPSSIPLLSPWFQSFWSWPHRPLAWSPVGERLPSILLTLCGTNSGSENWPMELAHGIGPRFPARLCAISAILGCGAGLYCLQNWIGYDPVPQKSRRVQILDNLSDTTDDHAHNPQTFRCDCWLFDPACSFGNKRGDTQASVGGSGREPGVV